MEDQRRSMMKMEAALSDEGDWDSDDEFDKEDDFDYFNIVPINEDLAKIASLLCEIGGLDDSVIETGRQSSGSESSFQSDQVGVPPRLSSGSEQSQDEIIGNLHTFPSTKKSEGYYGQKGIFENHIYRVILAKETRKGTRVYWRCDQAGCYAKLTTNANNKVVNQRGEHLHTIPDPTKIRAIEAVEVMKAVATTSTDSTVKIVADARASISLPTQSQMPSKPLLAQTARRSRKRAHNAPPDPRSRVELVIPNDRRMHSVRNPMGGPNQDELFLQYDSGPYNDRILNLLAGDPQWLGWKPQGNGMFIVAKNMHFYRFADGTFSVTPTIFEQLITVHFQYSTTKHVLPGVYALLPNKTQATYTRFFRALRDLLPNSNPSDAMTDFEVGLYNAIHSVFPNIRLSGCFFHLSDAFRRNAAELGLKALIQEDETIATQYKMVRALAFVPPADVIAAFEQLNQHIDQRLELFMDYIETNYIGVPGRRGRAQSRFAIEQWNVFDKMK